MLQRLSNAARSPVGRQVRYTSTFKKYTVQPSGIWALVSRLLAVDHTRSTGVPLNSQFRNPPPGALDPNSYDDPVTLPAADIADNPYWKRDVRRRYPRLSTVKQADIVALLSVGSKANPKDEVLQIGDAGTKQLATIQKEGEKGLAAFLSKDKALASGVLAPDGMPPMPVSAGGAGPPKTYSLDAEQSYKGKYPCRMFQ